MKAAIVTVIIFISISSIFSITFRDTKKSKPTPAHLITDVLD